MGRRSTPERIREARAAAMRRRLALAGTLPERVDAIWAAWEAQAERDGLDPHSAAYWTALDVWLGGDGRR